MPCGIQFHLAFYPTLYISDIFSHILPGILFDDLLGIVFDMFAGIQFGIFLAFFLAVALTFYLVFVALLDLK